MKLLKKIANALSSSRANLSDSFEKMTETPTKRRKTLNSDEEIPYMPIGLLATNMTLLQVTQEQHTWIKKRASEQLEMILRKCMRMNKKDAAKTISRISQVNHQIKEANESPFSIFECSLSHLPDHLVNQETRLPCVILELMYRFASLGGFELEGPFRLEGDKQQLAALIDVISKGYQDKNQIWSDFSMPVIAAAIKRYLRMIPGSLIPQTATETLLKLSNLKDQNLRILAIQLLLSILPYENMKALSTVLLFLKACGDREAVHKMSNEALAVCFGPTLFDTAMDLKLVCGANSLLNELISNHQQYSKVPTSIANSNSNSLNSYF